MRIRSSLLLFFCIGLAVFFILVRPSPYPVPPRPAAPVVTVMPEKVIPPAAGMKPSACARIGETITYRIKTGRVSTGSAVFRHLTTEERDGRLTNVATFETVMPKFRDKELIYSDAYSFLPFKVERDISNWPASEKITEVYDQVTHTLTVTKIRSGRSEVLTIHKATPLHNAILLPYFVRCIQDLSPGWSMQVVLPTQEFTIQLAGIETVKVSAGSFRAYHFTSIPRKTEIWITADERRIPVKIRNSGFLGYSMEMREYQQ